MTMCNPSIRLGALFVTLTSEQRIRLLATLTKAQMELIRSTKQLRSFFNLPARAV
jgi:hypothetical protein